MRLFRQMLESLLDSEGFAACYDFIYVPADVAPDVEAMGACLFRDDVQSGT